MKISLHTTIRTALMLVALGLAAALAGSALGGTSSGLNLPPQSAIDAASANWAAKAKLLDAYGHPLFESLAPAAAIDAASANWAAKAKLLDAYGRVLTPTSTPPEASSGGVDWADFGIGAAAMLGLLLLGTGLVAGTHYGRRVGPHRHAAA